MVVFKSDFELMLNCFNIKPTASKKSTITKGLSSQIRLFFKKAFESID